MKNFINKKFPLDELFNNIDNIIEEKEEKEKEIPEEEKIFKKIEEKINDINDLIKVGKKYSPLIKTHKFGFDMKILEQLINPLEKLELVIGMSEIKTQLIDQILSSLQNLYDKEQRFHTVIKGPPGVGKTMLAKILCEVYACMGILKNKFKKIKFKIAKRSDLIGKYLGHTAKLTQEVIDKCDGGVLFIDEVYSLGNPQKKDSFAKECIDTLNLNLTEKDNFVCIIAGYPEEIDTCFFAYNPGLRRRFSFNYSITKYSVEELTEIFIVKINISKWLLSKDLKKKKNIFLIDFFSKNIDYFPHFGGDIDTLILKCRTSHGKRIFGKEKELRKILTKEDLHNGFETYKLSRVGIIEENNHWEHMYV
jgi:SpoVK/Ycf46/Vps4 family AAA+-type ATPase